MGRGCSGGGGAASYAASRRPHGQSRACLLTPLFPAVISDVAQLLLCPGGPAVHTPQHARVSGFEFALGSMAGFQFVYIKGGLSYLRTAEKTARQFWTGFGERRCDACAEKLFAPPHIVRGIDQVPEPATKVQALPHSPASATARADYTVMPARGADNLFLFSRTSH